jgi:acyl-ACP thioesterase
MSERIHTESYAVTSYLVNLRGQAGLYSVLNFIQDVGWMHARALRIDLPRGQGWVFTRQTLRMSDWPSWNDRVTIRTWLRPPSGAFVFRDYEILCDGKTLGRCTSTFTGMDMQTRKLAVQDWSGLADVWRSDGHHPEVPEKILWEADAAELARFEVRNSDIDLNNHVNNTRYAQWILDSLPIGDLRQGPKLEGYEVNFLAETKIGDLVSVRKTARDVHEGGSTMIQFQGVRVADDKPVFAARMRLIPAKM